MAFPRNLLTPDEAILLDLRPHWWVLVPRGGALAAAAAFWLWVSLRFGGAPGKVLAFLAAVVLLVTAVRFLLVFLSWWYTNFAVTSERLIVRSGVLSKHGIEIPLERINTVFFSQGPFERVIGTGDLSIESASEAGRQTFSDVRQPSHVQSVIYRACEDLQQRGRERTGEALGAALDRRQSVAAVQELERLRQLLDEGAITEAEYALLKARVITDEPPTVS